MNENGYYIPPEDEKTKVESSEAPASAEPTESETPDPAPMPTPTPEYDRRSVITRACSSGLFLAICILTLIYTVVCALPSISFNVSEGVSSFNSQMNIPLLPVLVTIGLWVIYSAAGKGEFTASGMKLVSGSLKALRIVTLVVAIMLIVCAVLMVLGGIGMQVAELNVESFISYDEAEFEELMAALDQLRAYFSDDVVDAIKNIFTVDGLMSLLIIVLGIMFGIVGVIMIILNIFFYGYLYKFARSLREWGEGEGFGIRAVRGASNWLIVMAVFSCIGALSFSINSALQAAIFIVTSVFIKRNFYDYVE